MSTSTAILKEALSDSLPLIAGMLPFAFAFGVAGTAAGLPVAAVIVMSATVYAPLAQFFVVSLYSTGVTNLCALLGIVFLLDVRFFIMGVSLLPYTKLQQGFLKWLLPFGMFDGPYALVLDRVARRGYHLGYHAYTYLLVYLTWVLGTALGVLLSDIIGNPLEWGLDFAVTAVFTVLLLNRLKSALSVIVCLISGVSCVVLYLTGVNEAAIFAASIIGISAGAVLKKVPFLNRSEAFEVMTE